MADDDTEKPSTSVEAMGVIVGSVIVVIVFIFILAAVASPSNVHAFGYGDAEKIGNGFASMGRHIGNGIAHAACIEAGGEWKPISYRRINYECLQP